MDPNLAPKNPPQLNPRAQWMELLSRAPMFLLESALKDHIPSQPSWLRKPETGLMMVKGRVGGTGEPFNLGEITVTRCAIKIKDSQLKVRVGVAYVIGRSKTRALLAGVADALLQDETKAPYWQEKLIRPIHDHLTEAKRTRNQKAQETKVDFFTLAREAGGE
jgi:alpha-D-ribose 1-methylphosphonate 5-triphosphate synthase subunit PhnG